MKHLKKFENFNEEEDIFQDIEDVDVNPREKNRFIEIEDEEEENDENCEDGNCEEEITLEKKKMPWLKNKKDKGKDNKSKGNEKTDGKGLSASQKKLPEGLRKAIEKKKGK